MVSQGCWTAIPSHMLDIEAKRTKQPKSDADSRVSAAEHSSESIIYASPRRSRRIVRGKYGDALGACGGRHSWSRRSREGVQKLQTRGNKDRCPAHELKLRVRGHLE